MVDNKNKIDRIHDELPKYFKTRQNPNWKALVEAIGSSDQNLVDLVEQVRQQFFIKTASRPYLDRLGSNFNVSRPRLIGMQDAEFRRYIPILAYQPKQVKLVMDMLLDIFFFKETTTSFSQSQAYEPFNLADEWELEYRIDQYVDERIIFKSSEFTDINAATAEEVAGAINRQAINSFAIVFDDRIQKKKFIRLFTKTTGSKGSVQITGGRADIALQFTGFNDSAGASVGTTWTITKVGDAVTFQHTGGTSPNLNRVQIGDVAIIDVPGNSGSFVITDIDLSANSFTFINLFGTSGSHVHTSSTYVNFMTPVKLVIYSNNSRSVVWEVSPGQIIVEMPASPPVVRRSLIGSAHFNDFSQRVENRLSDTSLELVDASDWPLNGGQFVLQELSEIQTHILTGAEDLVLTKDFNTRFDNRQTYSYTSKSGNILNGITPNLPDIANLFEINISTATRAGTTVTVATTTPHGFNVGEAVNVQNTAPDASINGTFTIASVPTADSFTYSSMGPAGVNTGGVCRVERIGMANAGSVAYLTSAQVDTGIYGPYMWDQNASFVLSSLTSTIQSEIRSGSNVRTLPIDSVNNIPNEESFAIFDFGTESQEGPVRILYKPTAGSIQLDPAYVFKKNHEIGSSVTVIRRRGAIVMSGLGKEYGAYITDPAVARETLKELMRRVKSVGIFIEFLIRYPQQLYNTLDVYRSDNEALWQIGQQ